jgi:hypothetical protein
LLHTSIPVARVLQWAQVLYDGMVRYLLLKIDIALLKFQRKLSINGYEAFTPCDMRPHCFTRRQRSTFCNSVPVAEACCTVRRSARRRLEEAQEDMHEKTITTK